jgi:hypothetical protein
MTTTCWICGKPATTGEHKIKKSLLVELHGKGPYRNETAMVHVREGTMRDLQGPDSSRIKYQNSLCADCNNHGSQEFDRAYDQFFKFILENEEQILKHRAIDFHDVYGESFEVGQRNLYKYFVKLFGCDLAYSKMPVPDDLITLLPQDYFRTRLRITFAVNQDKLLMPDAKARPIGIGDLLIFRENIIGEKFPRFRWDTYFSFLHIFYWYGVEPDGPLGAKWTADSRYLYLGYFYPLDPASRQEMVDLISKNPAP